jgi:ankyrin repeat protein
MALHGGRVDLLEKHIERDPSVLNRTFPHEEIYPPELGCHDEVQATQGTPLKGTTLLHMCVDYDELEIAKWLIEKGADVNARAAVDAEGFGGHTALFCTVVSQPAYKINHHGREQAAPFTELLLKNGADPTIRASLRKQLHPGYAPRFDTEKAYEYRNVTAYEWGEQFHAKMFVSEPAMRLIAEFQNRPR